MNKQPDICTTFITPALEKAGWDILAAPKATSGGAE